MTVLHTVTQNCVMLEDVVKKVRKYIKEFSENPGRYYNYHATSCPIIDCAR